MGRFLIGVLKGLALLALLGLSGAAPMSGYDCAFPPGASYVNACVQP